MRLRELVRDRGVALLALVTLVFFWRPLTTQTFYFRDLYRLFFGRRAFLADALRSGVVPLWDPFLNGGQPFLAEPSNFAFHPSNVLLVLLPTVFAFNLVLVLHVFFSAVAAYWLARTLKLGAVPAFICGMVYGYCGFTLSAANLIPILLGLPWIPMTIGLAHEAVRKRRSLVPAAFAAAMPLFGAAAELTAMLLLTLAVWLFAVRCGAGRRRLVLFFAIALGAAGLSLLVILPATSIMQQSSRDTGFTYRAFSSWSVSPARLPELVIPGFFGDTDTMVSTGYWGLRHESNGYPYIISLYFGIPALLLAGLGAITGTKRTPIPARALAILAVCAVISSLGRHLPGFRQMFDAIPALATFRYPVKLQMAALLPVALLAALGAALALRSRTLRHRTATVAILLAAVLLATALAIAFSGGFRAAFCSFFDFPIPDTRPARLAEMFFHAALASGGLALALWLTTRARRRGAFVLACVVAVDLLVAGVPVNDFAPRQIFDPPPLARRVRELIGLGRFHSQDRPVRVQAPDDDLVWLARWQIQSLNSYTAAAFGIPVVFHDDFDSLAPREIARLGKAMKNLEWERRLTLLRRAGVTVFLATERVAGARVAGVIPAGERPLVLHTLASPVGRFVSRVVPARDRTEAGNLVAKATDLSSVVLENTAPQSGCGTAELRLLSRSLSSARYVVEAPCDGYVVFAENHYDGWTATIDGRPAPLQRADYAFTSVAVGAGRHVIERRYFPPRLLAGAIGSCVALLLLLLADRFWRRAESS
jgi:hypothetical protein